MATNLDEIDVPTEVYELCGSATMSTETDDPSTIVTDEIFEPDAREDEFDTGPDTTPFIIILTDGPPPS